MAELLAKLKMKSDPNSIRSLSDRLMRGWSLERALMEAPDNKHKPGPNSISSLARQHGLDPLTVHGRLQKGWSLEKALTTPVRGWKRHGPRGRARRLGRRAAGRPRQQGRAGLLLWARFPEGPARLPAAAAQARGGRDRAAARRGGALMPRIALSDSQRRQLDAACAALRRESRDDFLRAVLGELARLGRRPTDDLQRAIMRDKAEAQQASRLGLSDASALHKPGWRFSVNDDARNAREAAHRQYRDELVGAYKNPSTGFGERHAARRGQQPASAPPFSACRRAVRFDVRGIDHLRIRRSSTPGQFPQNRFSQMPRRAQRTKRLYGCIAHIWRYPSFPHNCSVQNCKSARCDNKLTNTSGRDVAIDQVRFFKIGQQSEGISPERIISALSRISFIACGCLIKSRLALSN